MSQRRLSENDRKSQIIEAALTVASTQGLEGMRVRAVAQAAGVSHGLVLHHFGSMDGLQSALLDWLLERVLEPQVAGLEEAPPHNRLMTFLDHQLAYLDAEPAFMDLVFDFWSRGTREQAVRNRIQARMMAFREAVEPIAADLIDDDPHRFRHTDARALAVTVGDLVLGYAIQRQIHPGAGSRETLLTAINALVNTVDNTARRHDGI